jgi:hypothetical protein
MDEKHADGAWASDDGRLIMQGGLHGSGQDNLGEFEEWTTQGGMAFSSESQASVGAMGRENRARRLVGVGITHSISALLAA